MANPLQTVAVANTSPDPMDALRRLSRVMTPEGYHHYQLHQQ